MGGTFTECFVCLSDEMGKFWLEISSKFPMCGGSIRPGGGQRIAVPEVANSFIPADSISRNRTVNE